VHIGISVSFPISFVMFVHLYVSDNTALNERIVCKFDIEIPYKVAVTTDENT
jgi:hypothetical protein